ncbi:MAG: hypothetical protein CL661_07320 [Bacteroidetes bacterium]|nr:hypothetical protein [Bacteroidota bacterium]|tara:strand:+ start:247 stop:1422 length:1176 start_codon:yes stop_codon:yes gene_type:complete
MKNVIYGGLFLAMAGIMLFACNKEDDSTDKYKVSDFEGVGIEHNKLLDETFVYLSENYNTISSMKEINNFIAEKARSYTWTSQEDINTGCMLMTSIFCDTKAWVESVDSNKFLEPFSGEQLKCLNGLFEILSDTSNSTEQKISNIEELEIQIGLTESFTNSDLYVLYSTTCTARHSLLYWQENFLKWIALREGSLREINYHVGDSAYGGMVFNVDGDPEDGEWLKIVTTYDMADSATYDEAVLMCNNLMTGWYLPSLSEWKSIDNNVGPKSDLGNVAGLTNAIYWSSNEDGTMYAWGYDPTPGSNQLPPLAKTSLHYVRPINKVWWAGDGNANIGGKIAGADAAGAATGAAGTALVNVIPGVGQAAYGATTILMGVGSSVGTMVSGWFDWL